MLIQERGGNDMLNVISALSYDYEILTLNGAEMSRAI